MFKSSDYKEKKGNSVPKIIQPGTQYCRILDIKLDIPPYKKEGYFIILKLEGVDQGDEFVGLEIDKNNPSLGHYRGQVANVKTTQYAITDYVFNNKPIKRDKQIFNFINNLAKQLNVLETMNKNNVSGATIEEYVDSAKKYLIDPELWAYFTIGGIEYFNEGYSNPNYKLLLPKPIYGNKKTDTKFPFALTDTDENFIKFDAEKHIIHKAEEDANAAKESATPVDSFEPQTDGTVSLGTDMDITRAGDSDMELPFS